MGKIEDMLTYLALKKVNFELMEMMTEDEKNLHIDKLRRDLDEKFQAQAFQEVLLSKYKSEFSRMLDNGEGDAALPFLKDINEGKRKRDEETAKSDYAFITVNPKPDIPLSEFKKVVEKSAQKAFIKKSLYVIEQRGENENDLGKGFHCHMMINKGDYRNSHLRREFGRTFDKYCDISNPHCFNISLCKEEDIIKRQNYMLGYKNDKTKHAKQKADKLFRKKHGIKDHYGELFIGQKEYIEELHNNSA